MKMKQIKDTKFVVYLINYTKPTLELSVFKDMGPKIRLNYCV